ncbi:MAG: class I tRNA ligase family protein, partial [Bacteroidales bacterium]|nr:class I tRNA ligase family protein [Bacteroidales bacterium]
VRMGMMLSAPAGNDILFDEALCEQGRNFNNKIWNALRLVKGWAVADIPQPKEAEMAIKWFESKLSSTINDLNDEFSKYRISEALMTVYKLFWDEFSAWYLELIKPAYQQPIDRATYNATIGFFEKLTLLLHPFMPFITEEIWQALTERKDGESIVVADLPKPMAIDSQLLADFEIVKEVVANIRTVRKEKNIPQKEALEVSVIKHEHYCENLDCVISKLCNISKIAFVEEKLPMAAGFICNKNEYFIPVGNLIDKDKELEKLQADLKYSEGFLKSVMAKLSNEKFVNNAPAAVIENERKKQADAESKIKILKEQIAALK